MMSLRSPLGRVLGRGSAKEGTRHWWAQRMTAVALFFLGIWFLLSLIGLPVLSRAEVHAWIGRPWNTVLLALLFATLAWHSYLGVRVIVEDYVHRPFARIASVTFFGFLHVLLAAFAIFAVLKIGFGVAA